MKTLIREYKPDDFESLRKCVIDLKKFESQFDSDYLISNESVNNLLNEIRKEKIFVAEIENKVVGFISLRIENKNDELIVNRIDSLYVSDFSVLLDFRGKGIGHKLMSKAEDFARDMKIKYIKLIVFSKNKAVEIYKEMGFVEYETTMLKMV